MLKYALALAKPVHSVQIFFLRNGADLVRLNPELHGLVFFPPFRIYLAYGEKERKAARKMVCLFFSADAKPVPLHLILSVTIVVLLMTRESFILMLLLPV